MASVIPEIRAPNTKQLATLLRRRGMTARDAGRHLLVLRFALLNMVGAAMLAAIYLQGWVDMVIAADQTQLAVAIFAVFVAGLAVCGARIIEVSRELNIARDFDPRQSSETARYLGKLRASAGDGHTVLASALRLELSQRVVIVRHFANSLVLLGLIGTVVGFIIALSGVDPEKAADFASISPMVSALISGMSTALYTTLVGAALNLWLMINYQMLATGAVKLITTIQELGERHVRS